MAEKPVMKPHAIMIAIPYQGHLTPYVRLAIKLASNGVSVTFAHTEHAHYQISKSQHSGEDDIFVEARASGLDIRYTTISDGFPLEFDRDANIDEYWEFMLHQFPSLVDEFVSKITEESDQLSFLVADTVAAWPEAVARKYNLVYVSFWTQPAMLFSIHYYTYLLRENGHYPLKDNHEHIINYIPGIESISTKDLPSTLLQADTALPNKILFKAFEDVLKSDFILHNTVQELESNTLFTLNHKQPAYAIGPVNFQSKINVSKSLRSETDCTEWLRSKPHGSVLYVSFGSLVQINKQVIQEIARGLLLSEVSFIWALRPKIVSSFDDSDVLPVGYENAVNGRGLVVPWCNQFAVLSNPAIGGFLTHCGWNSILESIWSGVPMICYPVLYDQPTNRKLAVDDWKIGINLCDGETVNGEEAVEKIKKLMDGETSGVIRKEMNKFSSILHNAVVDEGSSARNFDQFLKDLPDKLLAKREGDNSATDI